MKEYKVEHLIDMFRSRFTRMKYQIRQGYIEIVLMGALGFTSHLGPLLQTEKFKIEILIAKCKS